MKPACCLCRAGLPVRWLQLAQIYYSKQILRIALLTHAETPVVFFFMFWPFIWVPGEYLLGVLYRFRGASC